MELGVEEVSRVNSGGSMCSRLSPCVPLRGTPKQPSLALSEKENTEKKLGDLDSGSNTMASGSHSATLSQ